MVDGHSYPRQRARTRGFRLGVPKLLTPAPDGRRVAFVRSDGATDPVGHLWVLDIDEDGATRERLVVDARALLSGNGEDLPAEEAARRERLREVSEGITAFAVDAEVRRAAFALSGRAYLVDLDIPGATPRELDSPGPVIDPRPSPDASHVGYACAGGVYVVDASHGTPVPLAESDADHVTWGLADFIAAEEFGRIRGWWWLADGSGILATRVDESPVDTWTIADPAQPWHPAREQRYPAAGRPNAEVTLWHLSLDGTRREVTWDRLSFPYLTTVHASRHGDPVIEVLSRDQRHAVVLRYDEVTGTTHVLAERRDDSWVDIVDGAPALDAAGRLVQVARDTDSDTDRVLCEGQWMSPPGFQVRGIVDVGGDAGSPWILLHGSVDPVEEIPAILLDGELHPLVTGGIAAARRAADLIVVSATDLASTASTARVARLDAHSTSPTQGSTLATITTHATTPVVSPRVSLTRSGDRLLPTAVLWPSDHSPGAARLPVLLAPYGGPHARRVVASGLAFATDQWWADQGFCVVIADGRGTPGRGPSWEREVAGDLATPVLDDQIAALDAVLEEYPHDTDPDRVGIHGWSFGGYLAALAVLRRPDRVHAAVAGAPVTEWRWYDTGYTERYLGDPAVNAEAYDRCSLIGDAAALTRPLLLIHGLADDNVVVAHTLQLSSALLAAGRGHNVLPLSGVTHMTPQEVVAENLLFAQRDFLRTHLG